MKKFVLLLGLIAASCGFIAAQAPANAPDVMLQGFYWDSYQGGTYGNTNWSSLSTQVDEIAESFSLVWLPPSAKSSGGTGYHPKEWCNQTSAWGAATQLKNLISAFKAKGTRCVADIVINHRDGNYQWGDFCNEDFGTYGSFTLYPSGPFICSDDEIKNESGQTKPTGNKDAGYEYVCEASGGYCASRDLDHSNTTIQNAIKAYLKWMKNEMGYDGWRYDLVKGYLGKYTKDYNAAGGAYMSVGEYWDGDYGAVKNWINETGKTSMAFDFPNKYDTFNKGLAGNNFGTMVNGYKVPSGLCGADEMKRYAVTFIDNHDTFRDGSKYTGDWTKANAVLLAQPGIPCVFYPHWKECKADIKKMIAARRSVGIHSQSACTTAGGGSYYQSTTTGTNGSLICFVGSGWSDPAGYTKVCSGNGWAYYTKGGQPIPVGPVVTMNPSGGYVGENGKVTLSTTKGTIYYTTDGTTPSASSTKYTSAITITKNNTTIKAIAIDGTTKSSVVSGTFLTEKPAGLTVEFKAPSSWSSVNLYVWDANETPVLGEWPGKAISKNGDYYTYTITETDARPLNVIFNDGTNQTSDITGVQTDTCWDGTNPTGSDAKGNITPGTCGSNPGPTPPQPDPDPDVTIGEGYYICVNGTDYYQAIAQGEKDHQGRDQYMVSVSLKAGDKFQCYDGGSGAAWSIVTLEPYGAYQNFTAAAVYSDPMVCNVAGCYDLYIKLMYEDDTMYIGEGTNCSATPIKPTAIEEVNAVDLNIYPNPTNDYIKVDCAEDVNLVVIYSINGSEVIRTKSTYIDLSSLTPSLYFVNVMLQNGDVVRSKVIRK